ADIRDMECGAIAHVCMHAKIPCRSFKIISDLAGSGSTTEQYLKNLSICFETLTKELKNITDIIYG
ncbi:MAG: 5'-methylthioadenosine/adenosylhomocysteine nucleosidase, partial [Clostridia bacterium]|nr:5'-methylthioadenosine/adenosylhomocysteine nucleosidase [Clostridia bacterium]